MEVKLKRCKDCKWCKDSGYSLECTNPKIEKKSYLDHSTGEIIDNSDNSCFSQRYSDSFFSWLNNKCGQKARWFEVVTTEDNV